MTDFDGESSAGSSDDADSDPNSTDDSAADLETRIPYALSTPVADRRKLDGGEVGSVHVVTLADLGY